MGFYSFYCKKCDHEVEGLCNHDELDKQVCGARDYYDRAKFWFNDKDCTPLEEGCGNTMERVWKPISFSISGKSLDTHGVTDVNGHYSVAFGRYFKNKYAMHEYAESQGLRHVSQAEADEALEGQYQELKKRDELSDKWTDNLKAAGGDKVQAAAKTFVSQDMQDK